MWIAEFTNYKAFLKALIKMQPNRGRGQGRQLAEYLNVAPIIISQVLVGDRHFNVDQAMAIAEFYGLDEATTDYFVYSVSLERADTEKARAFFKKKLARVLAEAQKVKAQVQGDYELTELDKGIFYSNWYYCGVSALTSIEGYSSVDAIANYFGLPRKKISEILTFLLRTGLCTEQEGKLKMGTKSTHVAADSPFVNNHRRNWREKAMTRFSTATSDEIFFSGPVSMSKKDAEHVRKEILKFIKSFSERVAASPEETLKCLNIDWFEF